MGHNCIFICVDMKTKAQRVTDLSQVHRAGEWMGRDLNFRLFAFDSYPSPLTVLPKIAYHKTTWGCLLKTQIPGL